jgi:RNA polymerase primary sigma factor
MNATRQINRDSHISGEAETTWEDHDRPFDNRLIDGYARDLASAPLLDRDVEAQHALELQEAREAIADLVLDLPGETQDSILDCDATGPDAGRKWPLKYLDPCCETLSRRALDGCPLSERRIIAEIKEHKRCLDRARDALVVGNLRLVVHLAKEYHSYNISFMDLVQEGNLGLIEAVDRFECERGHRFGTYAAWWIRRSILLAFAEKSGIIRTSRYMRKRISEFQQVAQDLAASLGRQATSQEIAARMRIPVAKVDELRTLGKEPASLDPGGVDGESKALLKTVPDDSTPSPLSSVLIRERRQKVLAAVQLLEPREKTVLNLRFGMDGEGRRTLKEIGKILRVSRERVRQIERLAMARLMSNPDTQGL